MGYYTSFNGAFALNKPLTQAHQEYLVAFNETRRMKRDRSKVELLPDPKRLAVGLPVGPEGQYFVGAGGFMGQDHDDSIVGYNSPPAAQPGLWCPWRPNEAGTEIEWDGGEKPYDYVEWLEYLIHAFLAPWGYALSGAVKWEGEDGDDFGTIVVKANRVAAKAGRRVW